MDRVKLRLVELKDAAQLQAIYAPYAEYTAVNFDFYVPTVADFENKIEKTKKQYPFLVCSLNDQIVGYTYGQAQTSWQANQWNAELSIYVAASAFQKKLGTKMYQALIDLLKFQNIKNVYACTNASNLSSIHFHKRFDFETIGIFHKNGYKLGEWHDVVWLEKSISYYENPPSSFIPFDQLSSKQIQLVLDSYNDNASISL